jgi:hypothetical protein
LKFSTIINILFEKVFYHFKNFFLIRDLFLIS